MKYLSHCQSKDEKLEAMTISDLTVWELFSQEDSVLDSMPDMRKTIHDHSMLKTIHTSLCDKEVRSTSDSKEYHATRWSAYPA